MDDWEGSIDVEFNFGANVVPDDEEDDDKENEVEDDEDVDLTGVPEVGTIWNGMIVADMGEADEEGVEAAAYTVIMTTGGTMPPTEEVDFVLDRPFIFMIQTSEGLPLFLGTVNQP